MFLSTNSGPDGLVLNYATYESAVESLAHVDDLRALRKKHPKSSLPITGPKLVMNKTPHWDDRVSSYVLPFPGYYVRWFQHVFLLS